MHQTSNMNTCTTRDREQNANALWESFVPGAVIGGPAKHENHIIQPFSFVSLGVHKERTNSCVTLASMKQTQLKFKKQYPPDILMGSISRMYQ